MVLFFVHSYSHVSRMLFHFSFSILEFGHSKQNKAYSANGFSIKNGIMKAKHRGTFPVSCFRCFCNR